MHISKTRITPEEEKAVRLLRAKGLEIAEIETVTGISRTSVFRILGDERKKEQTVEIPQGETNEDVKKIICLLQAILDELK